MKRMFTWLLLCSLLTASLAWASDVHVPLFGTDGDDIAQLMADDPAAAADAFAICHYCGCGISHVLALLPRPYQPLSAGRVLRVDGYRYSVISHLVEPSGKPPRARV